MNLTEELIRKAIDGELSRAEDREFRVLLDGNPDLARQFRQLCEVEVELRNLDEKFDVSDRVMVVCRSRAKIGRVKKAADDSRRIDKIVDRWIPRIAIPLTAAAAVIIALVLIQGDPFETARIAAVEGSVKVMRQGESRPAGEIAELRPNDRIVVEKESRTAFRYEDETKVDVVGGSEVIYESDSTFSIEQVPSKKLELLAGRVEADVTVQPEGENLVVKTQHAYAIVKGTRFALESDSNQTRLEVSRGRVDLKRQSDGAVVSVGAGEFAVASESAPLITRSLRKDDSLVALYEFTVGQGETIPDRSGNKAPLDLHLVNGGKGTGKWLPDGGFALTRGAALFSEGAADRIVAECRDSGALSIEALVTPARLDQTGPARIVTLSNRSENVNFLLGQNDASAGKKNVFLTRIRTSRSKPEKVVTVESGKSISGGPVHIVVTCEAGGELLIFENGEIVARGKVAGDFSTWTEGLKLGVGGDPGDERFWEGTLHRVALFSRALSPEEVRQRFESGTPAN